MKLSPYLMFDGQCREAFKFYEQCLGGKIAYMGTYAEAPADQQAAPEMRGRIMHATLLFDDNAIMASDGRRRGNAGKSRSAVCGAQRRGTDHDAARQNVLGAPLRHAD